MLLKNNLCFWDTETSSIDPKTTQILSIGAVIVDPKKLEIIPDSEFYSMVKPEDVARIEAKALEINKLELSILDKQPTIDIVWKNFAKYTEKYRKEKGVWGGPVSCGYNISKFDEVIANRMNERFGINNMFHPTHQLDVMLDILRWRHQEDIKSISFDNMRKYMGMISAGAHNSLQDSKDAAALGIKFLKLYRSIKIRFQDAFSNGNDK